MEKPIKFDPYLILGVNRSAKSDEIREKYKQLSLKYHPDKGGDRESVRFLFFSFLLYFINPFLSYF